MSALQGPPRPQKTGNPQVDAYLNSLYQWAYQLWYYQTTGGTDPGAGTATAAASSITLRVLGGMGSQDGEDGEDGLTIPGPPGLQGLPGMSIPGWDGQDGEDGWPGAPGVQGTVSDSGVYTPTLTNVANLDASTAYQCQYSRVGSVVTVSGKVAIDPTLAATSTQLGISLPIASNIGANEDCAGAAFASGIAAQGAAILGDAANNRAQLQFVSADLTNQAMYFTFQYRII